MFLKQKSNLSLFPSFLKTIFLSKCCCRGVKTLNPLQHCIRFGTLGYEFYTYCLQGARLQLGYLGSYLIFSIWWSLRFFLAGNQTQVSRFNGRHPIWDRYFGHLINLINNERAIICELNESNLFAAITSRIWTHVSSKLHQWNAKRCCVSQQRWFYGFTERKPVESWSCFHCCHRSKCVIQLNVVT